MPKQTQNDKQRKQHTNSISSKKSKAIEKISKIPKEWRQSIKSRLERGKKSPSSVSKVFPSKQKQVLMPKLFSLLREDQLNCPICMELCIFPVSTECGHYYCLPCYEQFHKTSQNCCMCRAPVDTDTYETSNQLKKMIEGYVRQNLDWAVAEIYWNRAAQVEKIQERRRLPENIFVDQPIDVYFHKKWVVGKVQQISSSFISISVQYNRSPKIRRLLIFQRKSRKIAKHHSFTKSPWQEFRKRCENANKRAQAAIVYYEPDIYRSQSQLEGYMNGTISRSSWSENNLSDSEDLFPFMEESQGLQDAMIPNIWDIIYEGVSQPQNQLII